ncbi:hypothetical protein OG598_04225 [Micromonospora sp. NBC_00330]|uniref:hypothetical protein n=1 Tax=Micromonospora sp. NBC_00330 TaxID=2903585 RepID=UPI002E2D6096|nr:hypothetical protein [Micromonospora sp. NBC_00330]
MTLDLRGHEATIEQLCIDRQFLEAMASGTDPSHLALVFGISPSTAIPTPALFSATIKVSAGRLTAEPPERDR